MSDNQLEQNTILTLPVALPEGAQTDAAGRVAVVHMRGQNLNPAPRQVQAAPGVVYAALPRNNISLAWVAPQHLDQVLKAMAGCCNKKRPAFALATEQMVRRWTNGGR